ncbi:hypothetical protein [Desulforhopalus singaporensis]|uniref:hypothetical protein n=1 Tax=Desulforhopalus singaporensis TaxID=91360 RepID=UPI000B82281F|nr:hypothetical protein [Desulforhopalus singaporensis]
MMILPFIVFIRRLPGPSGIQAGTTPLPVQAVLAIRRLLSVFSRCCGWGENMIIKAEFTIRLE